MFFYMFLPMMRQIKIVVCAFHVGGYLFCTFFLMFDFMCERTGEESYDVEMMCDVPHRAVVKTSVRAKYQRMYFCTDFWPL